MTHEEETRAIGQLIERLVMRFPQVAAETVQEVVEGAHVQFGGARIRSFVPLLVEHDAVTRLRTLAGEADLPATTLRPDGHVRR